jgi:hypothetical protein
MLLVFFTSILCLSIHPPKKYALGANLIQKGLIVQNKVQGSIFFFLNNYYNPDLRENIY